MRQLLPEDKNRHKIFLPLTFQINREQDSKTKRTKLSSRKGYELYVLVSGHVRNANTQTSFTGQSHLRSLDNVFFHEQACL